MKLLKHKDYLKFINYLILVIFMVFAICFFIYFQGFPDTQFKVIIAASTAYFIWGILFHRLEGDLHPKIVVEYLLIAFLAVLLLRGAIFR